MKNTMIISTIALYLLVFSGCGLLGDTGVPKEQMNADITDKTISAQNGADPASKTEWSFKGDSYRCFAPATDDKAKITESNADIPINLSAIRLTQGEDTPVLFGKIMLHYKKDNGKWKLESMEPKDVKTNSITGDAFSKFVDLQMPLCNYYKYTTPIK
jgi:predicted small lipoprotein YifL